MIRRQGKKNNLRFKKMAGSSYVCSYTTDTSCCTTGCGGIYEANLLVDQEAKTK